MMFRFNRAVALAVSCIGFVAAVEATPLNLTPAKPDIFSDFTDVSYDAGSDLFSALGFAEQLVDAALVTYPNTGVAYGTFNLSATIDGSGNATAGSLSITGAMPGVPAAGPTLLTGNLVAFGYADPPGGDIFEFIFQVTGGDLATPAWYGSPGIGLMGVILTMNAPGGTFNGTFTGSFNNNGGEPGFGQGVSDTFKIPEPASLTLLPTALLVALRRRRAIR